MGIKNLLPNLSQCVERYHLSQLTSLKIGIDGTSWLYWAASQCARDLILRQDSSTLFNILMAKISLLLKNNVKNFIIVFDGMNPPIKKDEISSRWEKKIKNFEKAKNLEAQGDFGLSDKYYKQAIHINYNIIQQAVEFLTSKGITSMIAPYEADSQLAIFALQGFIDLVISEDSDLLAYQTPQILFKLDMNGFGDFIRYEKLFNCNSFQKNSLNLMGWNHEQFLFLCCLSGCDYFQRYPKMGIKTWDKFLQNIKTFEDLKKAFYFHFYQRLSIYEVDRLWNSLENAILAFRYAIVYDPISKLVKFLNPPNENIDIGKLESIVGPVFPLDFSYDLVHGNLTEQTILTCYPKYEKLFSPCFQSYDSFPNPSNLVDNDNSKNESKREKKRPRLSLAQPMASKDYLSPNLSKTISRFHIITCKNKTI